MDCVNHPGVNAAAYCQNCGKAMCGTCMRREPTGQIMCEPCSTAWHATRAPYPSPWGQAGRCPSPVLAALLGFIPGVGAMFNGQFVKGFLHIIIFAVLASMGDIYKPFGWLVAGWVFYQVFDAFQTARAKCEGQPLPDPLGFNELVGWFEREYRRSHVAPPPPAAGPVPPPAAGYAPPAQSYAPPAAAPVQYSSPYQGGYPPPYSGAPPAAGYVPNYPQQPAVPPMPPVPPMHWRRREPVAAIILIVMGVLFLLGEFSGRALHFTWPVLLIALGAWLVFRRMHDVPPAFPAPPPMGPQTSPPPTQTTSQGPRWEETGFHEKTSDEDPQGGAR